QGGARARLRGAAREGLRRVEGGFPADHRDRRSRLAARRRPRKLGAPDALADDVPSRPRSRHRRSRRAAPIIDMLVIHLYGESSRTPPTALHPKSTSISIADYPKPVKLLSDAFHGTAQRGASLPILYGEYGVQTRIPGDKLSAYTDLG